MGGREGGRREDGTDHLYRREGRRKRGSCVSGLIRSKNLMHSVTQ